MYCVKVEHVCSDFTTVLSGVPQSSVLGPILFLVYIDDICDVFSHNGHQPISKLFADDVKFYLDITCTESCDILRKCINWPWSLG